MNLDDAIDHALAIACCGSGKYNDEHMQLVNWLKELQQLRVVRDAAENLVRQKGRHNTEIAYKRLAETLGHNAIVRGERSESRST